MNLAVTAAAGTAFGHDLRTLTFAAVLARHARERGDKPFLRMAADGREWTYRAVEEESNRIAHGLRAAGIAHGDAVALLLDNSAEFLMLVFGLAKIGAIAVPVNTAARGDLLAYFLTLSNARLIVTSAELASRVREVRARLPELRGMVVLHEAGTEATPLDPDALDYAALRSARSDPPEEGVPDMPEVRFSDPVLLTFTSGTTGPSKATLYAQVTPLLSALRYADAWGYREDDVYYVCLPLFHINALLASTCIALMAGATVALSRRFSATHFWREVRETRATTFNLLASMVNILWARPPGPEDRDHRVRLCRATPMPAFAAEFEERFGMRLATTYGLTDYGVPVYFTPDMPVNKRGAAGRVMPGWQVRIVDEDDFDVPAGEPGEFVLRTDIPWDAPLGYHGMPEVTVASRRNGWFHTGDLARLDTDGYVWYVGRKKDAIRRRGENISAWEVEQTLLRHPAVGDAAVYAVPSELGEDEVAASIELREGATAAPRDLVEHCAANLAYFMVPRFVDVVPALPRNATQKIDKIALRASALADPGKFWDRERAGVVLQR